MPRAKEGAKILSEGDFNRIKRYFAQGYTQKEVADAFKAEAKRNKRRATVGLVTVMTAYAFTDYETYKKAMQEANKQSVAQRKIRENRESKEKEDVAEQEDIRFLIDEVSRRIDKVQTTVTENTIKLNQIIYRLEQLDKKVVTRTNAIGEQIDTPIKFGDAPFVKPLSDKTLKIAQKVQSQHNIYGQFDKKDEKVETNNR